MISLTIFVLVVLFVPVFVENRTAQEYRPPCWEEPEFFSPDADPSMMSKLFSEQTNFFAKSVVYDNAAVFSFHRFQLLEIKLRIAETRFAKWVYDANNCRVTVKTKHPVEDYEVVQVITIRGVNKDGIIVTVDKPVDGYDGWPVPDVLIIWRFCNQGGRDYGIDCHDGHKLLMDSPERPPSPPIEVQETYPLQRLCSFGGVVTEDYIYDNLCVYP